MECTLFFQDTGMIEAVSKYGLGGWIQHVASSSMKDIIDEIYSRSLLRSSATFRRDVTEVSKLAA